MTGTKDWYASTTVWGGIVGIIAAITALTGHTILPADQQVLVQSLAEIGNAAGCIIAIIGRMRATTTISASTKGN
jgi:hypothetical protein